MNKKSFLMIILAVFLSASIFAASDVYKVKSVTGKVTYQSAPDKWKNVTVGQELSGATIVNTSLNSTLVVVIDDKEITIKAMSKDTLAVLTAGKVSKGGLKKSGGLKTSAIGDEVEGTTKGTATASTRSFEGKADIELDE